MSSTITEVADLPITRRLVTGHDENAKSKVLYDGTDSNLRYVQPFQSSRSDHPRLKQNSRAFPSGGTSRLFAAPLWGAATNSCTYSRFQGIWSTDDVPVDLSSATASDPTKGTQFRVINNGSVSMHICMKFKAHILSVLHNFYFYSQTCSVTWTRPGVSSPMHHTQTIDYGVVLEGEVELELDNGETRVLKTGYLSVPQVMILGSYSRAFRRDVFVQRGTMHAWHNRHATKWAKLFCVVVASKTPAPEVQQASS
jgi:hypothetical protein